MEKLLFVPDVMERYRVSAPTARKIIRQCSHFEKPKLGVYENALIRYECGEIKTPGEEKKKRKSAKKGRSSWTPGTKIPMRA